MQTEKTPRINLYIKRTDLTRNTFLLNTLKELSSILNLISSYYVGLPMTRHGETGILRSFNSLAGGLTQSSWHKKGSVLDRVRCTDPVQSLMLVGLYFFMQVRGTGMGNLLTFWGTEKITLTPTEASFIMEVLGQSLGQPINVYVNPVYCSERFNSSVSQLVFDY